MSWQRHPATCMHTLLTLCRDCKLDESYCHAGFLVANKFFGSSANQLGIINANFEVCRNGFPTCNEPYGNCTAVNGGSVYDQFSTFRSDALANFIPPEQSTQCSFVSNALSTPSSNLMTQYQKVSSATWSDYTVSNLVRNGKYSLLCFWTMGLSNSWCTILTTRNGTSSALEWNPTGSCSAKSGYPALLATKLMPALAMYLQWRLSPNELFVWPKLVPHWLWAWLPSFTCN